MKNYYLILARGSGSKTVYSLVDTLTIGRGPDNTITLEDSTVSQRHAKVSFFKGAWIVEDLGSTNGIMLNGRRVEKVTLKSGNKFHIGRHVFAFIHMESVEKTDQLSETMQILSTAMGNKEDMAETGESELWSKRIQNAIDKIPFFHRLGKAERKKLIGTGTLHAFNAGEMIVREGDPGRSIYAVLDGQVRVFTRDHYGMVMELAILKEGQFFGEMAFLTGKPRSCFVETLEKSVLVEVSYDNVLKLVYHRSTGKKVLMEHYHERVNKNKEMQEELQIKKRRLHPRLNTIVPVHLYLHPQAISEDSTKSSSWKAESVDISMKGIKLAISQTGPEVFQAGAQVRLDIELPPPRKNVHTLGTIRRVEYAKGMKTTFLGIEFINTAATETKKLNEFIYGTCHIEFDATSHCEVKF